MGGVGGWLPEWPPGSEGLCVNMYERQQGWIQKKWKFMTCRAEWNLYVPLAHFMLGWSMFLITYATHVRMKDGYANMRRHRAPEINKHARVAGMYLHNASRYNSGNILMLPFSSYKPACDTLGLPNDRVTIRCLVCILGSTRLLEAFYKNGPVFLQGQHGKQKDLCKSQGAFYRLFQFANLGSHVNLYRCFWKNLWWSQVVTGDNRRRKHYHTTSYT